MLKRSITYEDFNGEEVTDVHYFNISKSEMIELEVSYEGGLQAAMQRIIEAEDSKTLIEEFKKIILSAYGQKSEDGKRFIKSDELRTQFSQTAAYDALFIELATQTDAATEFMEGILPKDLDQLADQDKPTTPPAPPRLNTVDS